MMTEIGGKVRNFLPHDPRKLYWIGVAYLGALFFVHLFFVCKYAVNVPSDDEWDMLVTPALFSENFDWKWVFERHNDHSHALTKILNFLDYRLEGWNLAHLKILNLFLIAGLVLFVLKLKDHIFGKYNFLSFPLFLSFLFSAGLFYDGTLWAIMSSMHLGLIFCLLSVFYMARWHIKDGYPLVAGAFSILSLYSFAFGAVACGIFLSLTLFHCVRTVQLHKLTHIKCWKLSVLAAAGLCVMLVLIGWGKGYARPGHHPNFIGPYHIKFWNGIFSLLTKGHGIAWSKAYPLGILILGFVGFPAWKLASRFNSLPKAVAFPLLCFTGAVGLILALISCGRSGFGHGQLFCTRYAEITIMLVPLTALNLFALGKYLGPQQFYERLLWGYFIFLCLANLSHFNFPKVYSPIAQSQSRSLACLREMAGESYNRSLCSRRHRLPEGHYSEEALRKKVVLLQKARVSFLRSPNKS